MERYEEKELKFEKENKKPDVIEPITTMKEKFKTREDVIDRLPETELADIIYIFIPSKNFGIKLYSRSPKSALVDGVFETDIHSIYTAKWDESINSQDGPTLMKVRQGTVATRTYIVSEQNFMRILNDIEKQKQNDRIIINVTQNKLTEDLDNYNVKDDMLEKEKMKDELLNNILPNNNYSNTEDKQNYEEYIHDNIEMNKIVK